LKALSSGHITSLTVVIPGTMTLNSSVYTGSIKATIASSGQVSEYCRHGYGVLKACSGSYHKGQWRNMVAHGYGESVRVCDGHIVSQYKGEFVKGKKHGSGKEITVTGVQEGTWCENKRHGEFKHYSNDGRVCNKSRWYNGNRYWVCNAQDAVAETTNVYSSSYAKHLTVAKDFTLPNGDKYTGDLKDNQPHGNGTASSTSGSTSSTYTGNWESGLQHGQGEQAIIDSNGGTTHYTGSFEHGVMQGYGRVTSTNHTYSGEWHNDKQHGGGIELTAFDTYIGGSFANGVRHGNGVQMNARGDTYVGTWRAGVKHGSGTFYGEHSYSDRRSMWDNGTLVNYNS
jgi:hypothetical protein